MNDIHVWVNDFHIWVSDFDVSLNDRYVWMNGAGFRGRLLTQSATSNFNFRGILRGSMKEDWLLSNFPYKQVQATGPLPDPKTILEWYIINLWEIRWNTFVSWRDYVYDFLYVLYGSPSFTTMRMRNMKLSQYHMSHFRHSLFELDCAQPVVDLF